MSAINFHTKEISVKLVYYGPGLCGKTTSLHAVYRSIPENLRPQLVSLATEVDRTIFFDFLPFTAYRIRDFNVRLQLYTVPGQVFYNATRKLVLNGVDGIVFVADSQRAMRDSNLESLQNLQENLADLGMDVTDVPTVIQANKRDLPEIDTLEEMDRLYNTRKVPFFSSVATTGEGVIDGLKTLTQIVINILIRKGLGQQLNGERAAAESRAAPAPGPVVPPPVPPRAPVPSGSPASPARTTPAGTLSEAASRIAGAAPGNDFPKPELPLWTPGKPSTLGRAIESALREERWGDAVQQADALVRFLAERWASAVRHTQGDPSAPFLLTRGASSTRYQTFLEAVEATRAGRAVTQHQALAAVVLVLEAMW